MEQRKYFKYRINELEEVYKSGNGNIAVLEELEEELHHRSTQRARKLLNAVQKIIGNSDNSTAVHTTQVHPFDKAGCAQMMKTATVVEIYGEAQ